ncbi:MAG: hypothetical protein K6F58_05235 [Bacteroidales bacterium]|nr:hypothetical protein [Bacteroidales bacterium]
MKNELDILGSTPVSSAAIASLYPKLSYGNQKVNQLEKAEAIIRLKRGMYVVNPEFSGVPVSTELIANHLYSPSYVSMHTALRWYGLIPERVAVTQSMTIKHSRAFVNHFGLFEYTYVDRHYFPIGLRNEVSGESSFIIASPEKALCDLIRETTGLNLRYIKEAQAFLEEDLRLDMDTFKSFNKDILRQCAAEGYKKKGSIQTLLKLFARL